MDWPQLNRLTIDLILTLRLHAGDGCNHLDAEAQTKS
jgi:hypothetical protein